jgi:hypothetical protein
MKLLIWLIEAAMKLIEAKQGGNHGKERIFHRFPFGAG